MKYRHKLLILAFVGTLLAIFWHEFNATELKISGSPRFGLVPTADDASYLSPPKNFIDTGVWADNSDGLSRYYQRPPGYGMVYGLFYLLLGKYALIGLKALQIVLFFLTLVLSGKLIHLLTKSEKWSLVGCTVMTIIPIYSGFMYYTLTEALTPFLLLWSIHSYLTSKSLFRLTFPFALLLLVRPQLLIFPIALLILALFQKEKRKILALGLAFIPFAIWMLRAALISGEFQGLHPIYSDTNTSLYRPSHAAMTDLFRVWESDGEVFHQTIAQISSVSNKVELNSCINSVPLEFQEKVKPIIAEYFLLLRDTDYGRTVKFKQKEIAFIQLAERTRKELISQSQLTYYLKTPVKSAIYLMRKSQLNLNIFQDKFRGNLLMELVRWICILIINLGMISVIIQLFRKQSTVIMTLSVAISFYFFYLIFFQRMNEERYLTPLLPLLLIIFIMTIQQFRDNKTPQMDKG